MEDLQMARVAMGHSQLPLAMNHLTRQLDRAPGCGEALVLLSHCLRSLAEEQCERSNEAEAGALLNELSHRLSQARRARYSVDAPTTPLDDITTVERELRLIENSITASADRHAAARMAKALSLAQEAHHWFKPNDRAKVREALRELRRMHDEQGPALSKDAIGGYVEALDRLKGLVADAEWAPLRVEAGWVEKGGIQ